MKTLKRNGVVRPPQVQEGMDGALESLVRLVREQHVSQGGEASPEACLAGCRASSGCRPQAHNLGQQHALEKPAEERRE
jgi:hypothetical protein